MYRTVCLTVLMFSLQLECVVVPEETDVVPETESDPDFLGGSSKLRLLRSARKVLI